MKRLSAQIVLAGLFAAGSLTAGTLLIPAAAGKAAAAVGKPATIAIDYPLNGSLFPPEITPPTFLWHDPSPSATSWTVDVSFANPAGNLHIASAGDPFHSGAIDPKAGPELELTPEQAATRTWKPAPDVWAKIKSLSVRAPATVTITGIADDGRTPVSRGSVTLSTSIDPVGAPVFYRDVPLMLPAPDQKGPITPLPQMAIPLIKWRLRSIAEPESRVVMENLPTCANCHSFSRDGRTFGLDLDGPRNDKGLYALVKVGHDMTIGSRDMIRWSSFQLNDEAKAGDPAVKRFGFMSQVSPNGRYVVTSIGPPNNANRNGDQAPGFAPGILDRLYSTNYRSIAFTQVFYPTRGVLAFYDRQSGAMKPLPGADDPRYVQTSAFWSPDGKYLIFSRALARDPYPAGIPKPTYANDPNETQIQYDLYKIPFNEGRGGKAVPVTGASDNGMSNNFPKVSPDGKWIVWVECKNGLLMRPDSKLFIVPFEGGKARALRANTPLMNSWHTFSPNGRWLAFSSKARGPYTQLMLTHIDQNGNDTPAILVENTTAANRAVNIPEFVNLPPGETIAKINPEATEFYSLFDEAFRDMESGNMPEAIRAIREAIRRDPTDALAHYVLATALSGNDQESEALPEYRKAVDLEPKNPTYLDHFAVSLDLSGDADAAIVQLQKAVAIEPASPEYQFNLGVVLESRGDFARAVEPLRRSTELSHGRNWRSFAELAKAYDKSGHPAEAVHAAEQAVNLAEQVHSEESVPALRDALAGYQRDAANTAP